MLPRGRTLFARYEFILKNITVFLRLLPKTMLKMLWSFADHFKGKLGLGARYCLASAMTKSCGKNVYIAHNVVIVNWENLSIGNNVSIHSNCYIIAYGGVKIGDDISIAHQCSIISVDHSWELHGTPIKDTPGIPGEIVIEGDNWIGCGVRILKGVTIGRRSIVAAAAVVKNNVNSGTMVAGIPAKEVRKI